MRGSDCADDKHTRYQWKRRGHCAAHLRVLENLTGCYRLCLLKLIWECRIIRQFVLEIMTRKFVLTGAVVAVLVTLTNVILAGANDYVFELVKTEIKSSNVGTIAVRLLHKPSERAVTDAVIVHTRIVMVHEGGTDMNAAFDPLGSPKPGVYAFRAPLTMAGNWYLSIAAKVPGEPETVVGKISFRVIP